METQQRSLVVTAAVGLIILAIIIGSIYYLVKFIQGRQRTLSDTQTKITASATPAASTGTVNVPVASAGQLPSSSANNRADGPGAQQVPQSQPQAQVNTSGNTKTLNTGDFQLTFPKDWGVLTCTNSANIELDPTNGADAKVDCNTATKPVTILVNQNYGCTGDKVTLGNNTVFKYSASQDGYTKYQWCTQTSPLLNITHRVSNAGDPAASKNDYSKQVEEMISKISFVRGS